jgi:hypothetical protein
VLAHAFLLHAAVDFACWRLPFGQVTRGLARLYPRRHDATGDACTIVAAVRAAAAFWPRGSTCLTEALTARCLLAHHGRHAALCVGVDSNADGFAAHAWLHSAGEVLIGGDVSRYRVIWSQESAVCPR